MDRILPRLSGADRTAFLAAARSYLGVRYRHQGRSERGVDCVGLPILALRAIGHECEDLFGYSPTPDGTTLQSNVEKHLGPPVERWTPGDIVLMRWFERDKVYCNHVGILAAAPYGNRWTLLHSHSLEKRVVEHALDGHWLRRVHSVYSLGGEP